MQLVKSRSKPPRQPPKAVRAKLPRPTRASLMRYRSRRSAQAGKWGNEGVNVEELATSRPSTRKARATLS